MTNDGGSAFPELKEHTVYRDGLSIQQWWPEGGLSLRDWFAGQAFAAMLARLDIGKLTPALLIDYAGVAYDGADELLKVRDAR